VIDTIIDKIDSDIMNFSNDAKDIFFGVDGSFVSHSLITILSIIKIANKSKFNFHIISSDIDNNLAEKYKNIILGSGHGLSIHRVSDDLFSNLRTTKLFSKATYYRFLAPHLVRNSNELLYLDADIVCLSSFEDLWLRLKESRKIALVVSESSDLKYKLCKSAGLKGNNYFNAGMMLIDVEQWNKNRISERAMGILSKKSQYLEYLDQDALNIVLEGNVSFIDEKFNTIFKLRHDCTSYTTDAPLNTVFLHYVGEDKPWQKWNEQLVCNHYRNIYRASPIAEIPFDSPQNDQQAKKLYKLLFKKKKFLASIYWRFKYYQLRYY
jgi:UDP-glucose:(glucosyl)LPS alpha-1,3-glucosyltransferase/UDP-D-galactose:(glucosyl)LPS alpha-1,3-D-galactosyltransferase/UDP-glucose:(galactosyl)LPS alpha-1,2-glucosyltransferase